MNHTDFCVSEDSTLLDAIAKIEANRTRTVLVTNHSKVVGVISEGDILRALMKGAAVYSPVKSFSQKSVKYLTTEDYQEVFDLVKQHGVSMVPILESDFTLKKVIRIHDLLDKLTLKDSL